MDLLNRAVVALALVASTATYGAAQGVRQEERLPSGLLKEPRILERGIEEAEKRTGEEGAPNDGLSISTGRMITGAGFIALGPTYRRHLFDGKALFSASTALSVRLYSTAQVSLELPYLAKERLRIGVQSHFQDALRVNYFGLGNDTNFEDRTGYRLTTSDTGVYAIAGTPKLNVTGRLGFLRPSKISPMAGRRPDNYPDTVAVFDESSAPGLSDRRSFVHSDLTVAADRRDTPGYPRRGGLYQLTWSSFADTLDGRANFNRLELDASHFVPVLPGLLTLAGHMAIAATLAPPGHTVPIYLLPNLGGRNARGYANFRFHDRTLQSYSIESRLALMRHLDAAVFADFGSVAASFGALSRRDLAQTYGVGVRVHTSSSTLARLDVGRGFEGWRVFFSMNDPFRRSSQLNGRPAVVPYVP